MLVQGKESEGNFLGPAFSASSWIGSPVLPALLSLFGGDEDSFTCEATRPAAPLLLYPCKILNKAIKRFWGGLGVKLKADYK